MTRVRIPSTSSHCRQRCPDQSNSPPVCAPSNPPYHRSLPKRSLTASCDGLVDALTRGGSSSTGGSAPWPRQAEQPVVSRTGSSTRACKPWSPWSSEAWPGSPEPPSASSETYPGGGVPSAGYLWWWWWCTLTIRGPASAPPLPHASSSLLLAPAHGRLEQICALHPRPSHTRRTRTERRLPQSAHLRSRGVW
jgi:hypothetical protein